MLEIRMPRVFDHLRESSMAMPPAAASQIVPAQPREADDGSELLQLTGGVRGARMRGACMCGMRMRGACMRACSVCVLLA